MMRFVWILLIVGLVVVVSGCSTRRAAVATSQPVYVPPPPTPIAGPPSNPAYSGYFGAGNCNACPPKTQVITPQPYPGQPGQQAFPTVPPAQQPIQPSAAYSPAPPQGFAPAPQPAPQAVPPAPTAAAPVAPQTTQPAPPSSAPPQVQLSAPEPFIPSQSASSPPPNRTPEPPRATALPAGIPQFGVVRDGVSSGQHPFDEGFDWLKTSGTKTVLHVRLPGEDDQADREKVEKRGMKYVALEVSPQTLQRKTLEEFVALINNASLHPIFVYDRDGSLVGGMWYGYFRLADMQNDDAARVRAGALGLRETRDGQQLEMWLSLQKIFSER